MAGSDSRHPAQPLAPGPSPQSHGDVLFPWASVSGGVDLSQSLSPLKGTSDTEFKPCLEALGN